MSTSTLKIGNDKFGSKLCQRGDLLALPEPIARGSRHKPIPLSMLVDRLSQEIDARGYVITREQLALCRDGQALFGVMDLVRVTDQVLMDRGERGMSFGFRASTNSSLALKGVAGTRVFVCDNLALSGSMIAFQHKSTTRLDFNHMVSAGFAKFQDQTAQLDVQIEELQITQLTDGTAKQQIFDIFNSGVCPVRLFGDVAQFYFRPTDAQTDCQPRTAWGLHNAFTRAMKDLPPLSLFSASMRLGKAFQMGVPGEVIDAEFQIEG